MKPQNQASQSLSLAPLLVAVLAACGGGGGGGGGDLVPTATVGFPTSGSQTDGDSITVSGRTTPGEAPIAMVRVAGVDATTSDGWETWSASVPLARGNNRLEVEIEDENGSLFDAPDVRVRRAELLSELRSIHVDPVRNIGWITDNGADALYAMNLKDGELQLISGAERGSGTEFGYPIDAVATTGNVVYVLDATHDSVSRVDIQTGDRSLLSLAGDPFSLGVQAGGMVLDPATGLLVVAAFDGIFLVDPDAETSKLLADAPDFDNRPQNVAVDPTTGTVYIQYHNKLDRIDTASGKRTTLSDEDGIGKGDEFRAPRALDVDPKTGQVWILNVFPGSVLVVDPDTGIRETVVAMKESGSFSDLAFDSVNAKVLFSDKRRDIMYSLDPDTGQVEELIGGVGHGDGFSRITHIEHLDGLYFGLDASTNSVVTFEGDTGDRRRLFEETASNDEEIEELTSLSMDLENGRALVADAYNRAIYTVSLETDDVDSVGNNSVQGGFRSPDEIARLTDGKLLVMDNEEKGIFTLDPQTGIQRVISRNGDGQGPDFVDMQRMVVGPEGKRAYVTDFDSAGVAWVKQIDLETGSRTNSMNVLTSAPILGIDLDPETNTLYLGFAGVNAIYTRNLDNGDTDLVSDSSHQGPELNSLGCLELDLENQRILTWSYTHSAVVAVSLVGGDRVIVSK